MHEEFQKGDRVWARNEEDRHGPVELREIEEVFVNQAPIWHVHVDGHVIRTTAEHPFWVEDHGWTPARELQPGDTLVSHDGQFSTVEEVFETGEWETVYNFRVAEHHTYFVGSAAWGFSVWAHNSDECTVSPVPRWGMMAANPNIDVRNNQGQRIPVWGTPQRVFRRDGTDTGHADRVLAELQSIAANAPNDSYIMLDRAWRTATNRVVESRLRPDIILVERRANGQFRISAWEVQSGNDDPDDLRVRLNQGWSTLVSNASFVVSGDRLVVQLPNP